MEYSRIYAVQLLTDWLNLFMTWYKGLHITEHVTLFAQGARAGQIFARPIKEI